MRRTIYRQLCDWKTRKPRKPLLLRGARQVGKTWLLKEFGRQEFRKTHYVNFENAPVLAGVFREGLSPSAVLPQLSVLLKEDIDPASDLLIFDEVQNSSNALTCLKYFREELPQQAICCAGSHIGLTVSDASFPVGQVEFLTLYPLTFEEFLAATDERSAQVIADFSGDTRIPEAIHQHLWEQLKKYYVTGGLPEVVDFYRSRAGDVAGALRGSRQLQESLLAGYQSDFAKHAGKVNAVHINRVLESVPVQMSRAIDGSVGRFRFGGVIPNKSKFSQLEGPIEWLVKAGLVLKVGIVEKPDLPLRAFAGENLFKLYVFDVGMLGCMLELPIDAILNQDYGTYKGYYAENVVAQELVAAGKYPLYSWRGREAEIEFLVARGNSIVPVEVKAGTRSRSRSLAAYVEKFLPSLRIKVTARNLDRRDADCHNFPLYLAGRI